MDEYSRPVIITKRIKFSSSHRLHSPFLTPEKNKEIFGKCNHENGHGHNYIVEVSVKGVVS